MSTSSPKTTFGWIAAVIIAVAGSITALFASPDARCTVGLTSEACPAPKQDVKAEPKEAELIIQSDIGEPLGNVKIQFIAAGAPEVQFTDVNGYAKVKIPSEGDVRVILTSSGYPTQDFVINFDTPQNTRIIRLSQTGTPNVKVEAPLGFRNPSPSGDNSLPPTDKFTRSHEGIVFQLTGCKRENESVKCELLITDQKDNRLLFLHAISSTSSRAIARGYQYNAKSVEFSGNEKGDYVQLNLSQNIELRASVNFETVPIQTNQLELLEVAARSEPGRSFSVKFSEIPVSN